MILWMLASFLRCHSNTKTLNLTVCELRRRGAYARDKNTSTRLWAKNEGGGLCARGGVFAGHYGTSIPSDLAQGI